MAANGIASTDIVHVGGAVVRGIWMLDSAGILFSSLMILIVILKAIRLDRVQPWFQVVKQKTEAVTGKAKTWRRQS
jgi:hypothetical protein